MAAPYASPRYSSNSRRRPESHEDEGAQTTSGQAPDAAEDHDGEHEDRDLDLEARGRQGPDLDGEHRAPSEPIAPPIANASSLKRVMPTPIASAVCSSSRIAVHARPILDSESRCETNSARSTNASAR